MNDDKLIKSFYRDYQNMHKMIEGAIPDSIESGYLASRILDRIIILVFLKYSTNTEMRVLETTGNIFEEMIRFYDKPHLDKSINIYIQTVLSLFKNDSEIYKITLSNDLMSKIIKALQKYKWSFKYNEDVESITPDLLGKVFEKYINQKENGAYYTETDTIEYINNNTILYGLIETIQDNKSLIQKIYSMAAEDGTMHDEQADAYHVENLIKHNCDLKKFFIRFINENTDVNSVKQIYTAVENFRILDITAGTGAFLIGALNLFDDIYSALNINIEKITQEVPRTRLEVILLIIENNLFGVDIMQDAIEIAKFRMYLYILAECIAEGIPEDKVLKQEVRFNLKVGNAISGRVLKGSNCQLSLIDNKQETEFCWEEQFPDVFREGGFDCIVGNPPYVEYSKIKDKYEIQGFKTFKCGNIYAFVVERAIEIIKSKGVIGVVIPISIGSTPRMKSLRSLIEEKCSALFISNYGDRPGVLFNGVHQKVSILIAKKEEKNEYNLYTTQYYHWYKEERASLFKNLKYVENKCSPQGFYYKVGNSVQCSIIDKLSLFKSSVLDMCSENGDYKVYLNTRLAFWVKCFLKEKDSKEFKRFSFQTQEKAYIFSALLNSSLYYFIWEAVSDAWHITKKDLLEFKFEYDKLTALQVSKLVEYAKALEVDLETNKVFIGSKQAEYEYRHKKSKIMIDKIDQVLQEYYQFTNEQCDEIINYSLSYRMNDELEPYLKRINEGVPIDITSLNFSYSQ